MKLYFALSQKAILIAIVFLQPIFSIAQGSTSGASVFDMMSYKEVSHLTLESDFEALKSNPQSKESQKAKLSFKDANGKEHEFGIKVNLRGAYRRMRCTDFPPIKLNFKKSELEAAGLATFDDMKLVTQCLDGDETAKELLLKEYLTYKLYNALSEYSFRVQLVKITYRDTNSGKKEKQWAFLIEDTAELRHRLNAEKTEELYNLPVTAYHHSLARQVALFQYMIGNADWGYTTLKNLKVLEKKGKLIPVPYDFDFSGLVNASYAVPNTNFGLTKVTDRIYLGFPEIQDHVHGSIYHLVGHRAELLSIINDFKYLSTDARDEMVAYLEEFFNEPEALFNKKEVVYIKEKMAVGVNKE